jgi:hypothetical protein
LSTLANFMSRLIDLQLFWKPSVNFSTQRKLLTLVKLISDLIGE